MTEINKPIDFEASLTQLTSIIEKMENGQLTLEQSLQHFEQGVALVHQCQKVLSSAEQKISILIEKQGDLSLTAYEPQE